MSLIIALEAAGGIVLAADSRSTEGYTLEGPRTRDDSIKFIQLKDNLGILTYGFSEIGYEGIISLKKEVEEEVNRHLPLSSILDKAVEIFNRASSDWWQRNPEIKRHDKDTGFILAGFADENLLSLRERDRVRVGLFSKEKGFRIFNFQSPDFLPRRIKGGCLLAGQWHIAKFFTGRLYTGRGMPIEKARDLAVFLLNATMVVEKTVGGTIRVATITESNGFQWISEDEVNAVIKKNSAFSRFFQEQLYLSLLRVMGS